MTSFANRPRRAIRTGGAIGAMIVLAGCTGSVTETLRPEAASRPAQSRQAALAPASGERTGSIDPASSQAAPASTSRPVAFLPVTGAPQSAVTDLAASMREAARGARLPVVGSTAAGAEVQLKGYFSAISDDGTSILVYVWDVLDARGKRIHRISGQERGSAARGDPWAGVTDDTTDRVARVTVERLSRWLGSQG